MPKLGSMCQISSYPLPAGGQITIDTAPRVANYQSNYKLINSARTYFYAVSDKSCDKYSFVLKDESGDIESLPAYTVPYAIAEWSVYPSSTKNPFHVIMTFDTSNVDNFELLLGAQISGTGGNAYSGNPHNIQGVSTATAVGSNTGSFASWLDLYASAALSSQFKPLQLTPSSNGYTGIESPTDFINTTCAKDPTSASGKLHPSKCKFQNAGPHWNTLLNTSYYETDLGAFFTNAINGSNKLIVMGDAANANNNDYSQEPWQVTSNTASCPILLDQGKGQAKSLTLTPLGAATPTLTICNPSGQVLPLPGASWGSKEGLKVKQTNGAATATLTGLNTNQIQTILSLGSNGGVGWNIGQPETGWVGNITNVDQETMSVTVNVIQQNGPFEQQTCVPGKCPTTNPAYKLWVLSNIKWGASTKWFETASEMVFANDGAFSDWAKYYTDKAQRTVLQSIMRNIVAAINRGVHTCTNVTGDTAACTRLQKKCYVSKEAYNASDAYWTDEANWYPSGGRQNFYAQYLHVAAIDAYGKIGR